MPDWQNLDDIQLLAVAQGGDGDAFGELYHRHGQAVFRFLFAHLNDRMDAEDLTEEVFLRVWRTLPSYTEQGVPFLAYLFRVARNALIDFYRRSARSGKHLSLDDSPLADTRPEPGEAAMLSMEHEEIRQTLEHMTVEAKRQIMLAMGGH